MRECDRWNVSEGQTHGRTRMAGGAIRGAPDPPAGGGLPDARLAERGGRRRVRGAATDEDADLTRQRAVVDAFLAASREGNFDTLLALLDPDVVLHADPAAVATGATAEVRGAPDVARQFAGRARVAQPAL